MLGLWGLFWASPALAEDAALEPAVDIHGFVSQGFIKSTDNNYLGPSARGSFEFTEVGINFTRTLTDDLRVGMQVFAHDLGTLGNYTPTFDWFYIDYHFRDWLGIRAGRTKLPFGLYNELNDIGTGRVSVLLPQSVYPVTSREFLLAQTGVELYGLLPLAAAGAAEYRIYGGTIFLDTSNASGQLSNFTVPYLVGGRLMWLTPIEGLQLGGSVQALRLDFDYLPSPAEAEQLRMAGVLRPDYAGGVAETRAPIWLWVASVEWQLKDLLLAAEYERWYLESEGTLAFPDSTNEGIYALGSYRLTPWFAPGIYVSVSNPELGKRSGRSAYQRDLALTLRFDIDAHWLAKVEGHYMHGTGGLDPNLNGGGPGLDANTVLNGLTKDWGVLLLQTTAYF